MRIKQIEAFLVGSGPSGGEVNVQVGSYPAVPEPFIGSWTALYNLPHALTAARTAPTCAPQIPDMVKLSMVGSDVAGLEDIYIVLHYALV